MKTMSENLKPQVRTFDQTLSAFDVMAEEFQLPMIKEHIEKKTDFEAIQNAVDEYVKERNRAGENIKRMHVSPAPGATPEQVISALRAGDEFMKKFHSIPQDFRDRIHIKMLREKIKNIQELSHAGYGRIDPVEGIVNNSPEEMQEALRDIWGMCEGIFLNSYYSAECVEEWEKQNGK